MIITKKMLFNAGAFLAWTTICVIVSYLFGYAGCQSAYNAAELKRTLSVVEEKTEIRNNRPDDAKLIKVLKDEKF